MLNDSTSENLFDWLSIPIAAVNSILFLVEPKRTGYWSYFNTNHLPNYRLQDQAKFKASAGHNLNMTQKPKLVLGRVENIVGADENAGNQYFLLFFPKPLTTFLSCFSRGER